MNPVLFLKKIIMKKSLFWAFILGVVLSCVFLQEASSCGLREHLKEDGKKGEKLHYPTAGVVYSAGSTRYSLRYVKQVEGVVCSGGICRLEPAFSGVKLNVSANF